MLYRLTISSLLLFACLSLQAQTHSTAHGVNIREKGLRAVVSKTKSHRHVLAHRAAGAHPDLEARRDVLIYEFYAPEDSDVRLAVSPAALRKHIQVQSSGSYSGYPVRRLVVDLLHDSNLRLGDLVDSFDISISWDRPLEAASPLIPPSASIFLNPSWRPRRSNLVKRSERTHAQVEPQSWYDRFAKYKKVHTSRDGIAVIRAAELLGEGAVESIDNVALYWRGKEQPVHIDDVDSNGMLSQSDMIFFQGRRPKGDSLYYDIQDSVAVFYITTNAQGKHERFSSYMFADSAADTATSVYVHQHVELDTGYYHPGSGVDEDQSIFESSLVYLEGYYWKNLYGRSKQYATFTTRFTPAREGAARIDVLYATTTANAKYAPEHVVSVWPPAKQTPSRQETEGFQSVTQTWSGTSASLPSGLQRTIVQATGTDELRSQTDWYSEILVDAVEISGDALPVLDSGRLHCTVTVKENTVLELRNVNHGRVYVLDTARHSFGMISDHHAGHTVRAGIWPDIVPDVAWNGVSFSASVSIGSTSVVIDSLKASHALVVRDARTGALETFRDLSAPQLRSKLRQLPSGQLFVIVNAGSTPDRELVDDLRKRGVDALDTEIDHVWIASANQGKGAFSKEPGLTAHFSDTSGSDGSTALILTRGSHQMYLCDTSGLEHARIVSAKNQGVYADTTFGDVIAIAHRDYLQEASRWAQHRYQYSGKRVALYDVDAIIEEYGAGRRGPEAIRAFLTDAFNKSSTKPSHCVLIGNASWDPRLAIKEGNVGARRVDQVPTYGRPSTDMWFGLLDDEYDLANPELLVTRFPVSTVAECKNMVDKIIMADTALYSVDMRRFLFVGGGTEQENFCELYRRMLDDTFGSDIVFTEPPLCIDTVTVCNTDFAKPGLEIRQKINGGAGWMNYIGHGGTDVFDIADWEPQDLNNSGRYPILATFSCLTGNYSSPNALCENASYLVEPNKGMVAAMGATGYQYLPVVDLLHFRFHEAMLTKGLRSICDLTYEAKKAFSTMNNQVGRNAALQYCILGDPFTRLRIDTVPDLRVYAGNVRIRDQVANNAVYLQQGEFTVDAKIINAGVATREPVEVVVRRFLPNQQQAHDSVSVLLEQGLCSSYILNARFPTLVVGRHRIEIVIDPRRYTGYSLLHAEASISVDVLNRSLKIIVPDEYGGVSVSRPHFRFLYPYLRIDTTSERLKLTLHTSRENALQGRAMTLRGLQMVDHGSYVDVFYSPTEAEASGIDTAQQYWLHVSSPTSEAVVRPFMFRRDSLQPDHHVVYAVGGFTESNSIRVDSSKKTVSLNHRPVSIVLQSRAQLSSDPVRLPSLKMAFGDTTIQSSFRNGINIFVIRPFSTSPRLIRRYDTSPTPSPRETGHSGGPAECIAFLRDSVLDHEIVAIAACNESFTQFETQGYMSEFRAQLEAFGCKGTDSITIGSALAFIGSNDRKARILQRIVGPEVNEVATIADSLQIRYSTAVLSPIRVERPQHIKYVQLDPADNARVVIKTYGYDTAEPLIDTTSNVWTAFRNASTVRSVEVVPILFATDQIPGPEIRSISVNYQPAPMMYVDSISISIDPLVSLQGDTVKARYTIRNLHTHYESPVGRLFASAASSNDTSLRQVSQISVPAVGADGAIMIEQRFYNDPSWPVIRHGCDIEIPGLDRALHPLFQSASRSIVPKTDSTKPIAEVVVNGQRVVSETYVDSLPTIVVQLRDASQLPVNSDENFIVFVNGMRIRSATALGYRFLNSSQCSSEFPGSDVRAAVEFKSPMEQGENLVIARVTDASGNKDTAEIFLRYSSIAAVRVTSLGPNPATNGVTFQTVVSGSTEVQEAQFTVFDLQGRNVYQSRIELKTGSSSYTWDGMSETGNALPPGVYYWALQMGEHGDVPVENRSSGMVIILR